MHLLRHPATAQNKRLPFEEKRLCRVTRWFFLGKSTTPKADTIGFAAFISAMQVQVKPREATHLRLSVVSQGIVGYLWFFASQYSITAICSTEARTKGLPLSSYSGHREIYNTLWKIAFKGANAGGINQIEFEELGCGSSAAAFAYGARDLARDVLKLGLEQRSQKVAWMSWTEEFLTAEQIECATVDAYVAYKTGKKLLSS
ncbi:hypothetical protein J5N97_000442 [Dioscorea zingiberensis]|uniref:Uncharacterized protein n=1 Tax=Dioscorea zingiberensis TaxID=325984 RepID=A0A9D5BSE9_9LILI|nr:hypothetical protein J5N97_000442 [Dioscorea zingiberensis]